uniref:Uncharacterized protein n=1 Tax=Anguilla anguilla TaxID=7936 RepID=A0A0E9U096_ANGAN
MYIFWKYPQYSLFMDNFLLLVRAMTGISACRQLSRKRAVMGPPLIPSHSAITSLLTPSAFAGFGNQQRAFIQLNGPRWQR